MSINTLCPMINPIERREHKNEHVHTRDAIFEWLDRDLRPEQAYEEYVESRVWERDGKSEPSSIGAFKQKYATAKKQGPPDTWSICGKPANYVIRGTGICALHVKEAIASYPEEMWNTSLLYDLEQKWSQS
jgi:hypothetical protein